MQEEESNRQHHVLQGYRRRPIPSLSVAYSTGPRRQREVAIRRRSAAEPVAVEGRLRSLGQARLGPGILPLQKRRLVIESPIERVLSCEGGIGIILDSSESLSDSSH